MNKFIRASIRWRMLNETLSAIRSVGKRPVTVAEIVKALGDKRLHRSVLHRVALLEEEGLVHTRIINKGRYGRWKEVYLKEV
jgi:ADP-dependent phosphofructokinase/glucokinase